MEKTMFGTQPWQGAQRGFRGLGAPSVCSATSLEPIPSQVMSAATQPTASPELPPGTTIDTLTPTLVVGTLGVLALAAFGIIRF